MRRAFELTPANRVAFDETCQFCVAARQARARAKAHPEPEEEEYCACCEMVREEWREKHREVLAKAGLVPASGAAIAGAIAIATRDRARRDKPS